MDIDMACFTKLYKQISSYLYRGENRNHFDKQRKGIPME